MDISCTKSISAVSIKKNLVHITTQTSYMDTDIDIYDTYNTYKKLLLYLCSFSQLYQLEEMTNTVKSNNIYS